MSALISHIKNDKILYASTLVSFTFFFLTIGGIAISYQFLPPLLPVYNQMPWGDLRLGTRNDLFLILLLGVIMYILNTFCSYKLYRSIPLLSRILHVTNMLLSLFIFALMVRTILIVL
ncbi:MAG: hypothetical protein AAB907_03375 [Patescibacteria group bacterium]